MQVDLFNNTTIKTRAARTGQQIETRKCVVLSNLLDNLPKKVDGFSEKDIAKYYEHIRNLATKQREYTRIGYAASDSLWELELLGICDYTRKYMIYIDFSNALDFVLEQAFDCNREEIRKMESYDTISKQLLTYDLADATAKIGILFDTVSMKSVYLSVMNTINKDLTLAQASRDEKLSAFVYKFYTNILQKLADIKDYVAAYLTVNHNNVVYRSKTFSSVILTSDEKLDSTVELCSSNGNSYSVPIKYYKMYDWVVEGINNEITRSIQKG